ncbi:unnamed protein product, partial [Coregonus sp. 'balchen']
MSWCPPYRSSKFRHVYGKASTKDHGYHGIPITHSVHDNHYCSVNPRFIAITGRVDPHHPRVCGHSARVLDVKWNPFDDHCIASCSEDCTVKLWDIPARGVHQNMTLPRKELQGHTRRLVLSMSFNNDGSSLATTSLDRKIRVLDPRTGRLIQGDGNIRYYEISSEKPYVQFLTEYYSLLPQKGLGVMPKRGLDVSSCEVFRFYRLVTIKDLVEPLSMIVPRRSPKTFQEDIFPMTAGNEAALTAQQWLSGINRGPVLMCLKPGTKVANPYPETPPRRGLSSLCFQCGVPGGPGSTEQAFLQEQLSYQDAKYPREVADLSGWQPDETQAPGWAYTHQTQAAITPHCCEPSECPPPRTESERCFDVLKCVSVC